MPSGSHGGSSGSHSSGGSSFGGGGSSWNGSSHSYHRSGSRTFIFWGRPYSVSGGFGILSFFCSVICVFAFVAVFGGFVIAGTEKSDLNKIEEDYAYYQDLIDLGHTTNATVTDMFAKYGKYYITYKIDIPNSTIDLEGYSYSVYTREEAFALLSQGTITVALNHPVENINLNTDSVPIDYKDMQIERDGEYLQTKQSIKTGIIVGCVSLGAIILSMIVNFIAIKKSNSTSRATISNTKTEPVISSQAKSSPRYCKYCGAEIPEGKTKCSSCGSRVGKN